MKWQNKDKMLESIRNLRIFFAADSMLMLALIGVSAIS